MPVRAAVSQIADGPNAPAPGFAGYSPDYAGERISPLVPAIGRYCAGCVRRALSQIADRPNAPSPGFAGYSPDYAGERISPLVPAIGCYCAGCWPVSSKNPSSVRTGTFSRCAFSSFDPAASPATT